MLKRPYLSCCCCADRLAALVAPPRAARISATHPAPEQHGRAQRFPAGRHGPRWAVIAVIAVIAVRWSSLAWANPGPGNPGSIPSPRTDTTRPFALPAPATAVLQVAVKESASAPRPAASRSAHPGTSRPKKQTSQTRIDALTEENRTLKAELATRDRCPPMTPEVEAKLQTLTNELLAIRQTSANALQLQAERDHLHESVIRLERELETVKRAKQSLEADSRLDWFLVGAGVLSAGIVLGLIVPRLSWRKRSSWDSF